MKKVIYIPLLLLTVVLLAGEVKTPEEEAKQWIDTYTRAYQPLNYESEKASWLANTDIKEENTKKQISADKKLVEFEGNKETIRKAKEFLAEKDRLTPLTIKQLEVILYKAASGPGTIPEVTSQLVEAEARQVEALYGFQYKLKDGQTVTPNQIDDMLKNETDPAKRLEVWECSKEVGKGLKQGLARLRDFRNRVAREMGYTSYFDLETSDYGMRAGEMAQLMDQVAEEIRPLYSQLYTWVKYKLADRYHQPVPERIPAHWLTNRWGQEWPNIAAGNNFDELFKDKSPQWIVRQAEKKYGKKIP